jgi:hypothetical protein
MPPLASLQSVLSSTISAPTTGEQPPVEQLPVFDQLQLRLRDPVQRRYASIRPLLLDECTAAERAAHTHLHPDTIGKLKRRFEQQGMLGLFPTHVKMRTRERRRQVPPAAVEELQRLKGLYGGFH